jgi:hypothetical protein
MCFPSSWCFVSPNHDRQNDREINSKRWPLPMRRHADRRPPEESKVLPVSWITRWINMDSYYGVLPTITIQPLVVLQISISW